MTNTKIALLFLFLLLFNCIKAQSNKTDIVILKDGSIIRGHIIEYFVNQNVRIVTRENKIYNFSAMEIYKVKPFIEEAPSFPQKGYFNNTSFGVLIGEANYNSSLVNFSFNTINGYQINPNIQAGIGLGMDVIYQRLLFPVFVDVRYYFKKSEFSPYISAYIGKSYTAKPEKQDDYWSYYNNHELNSGRMYGIEMGIRNYTKNNVGYTLAFGYRFQYLSANYRDGYYITEVFEEHYLNRFKLTLGVIFN